MKMARCTKEFLPLISMVIVQVGFAVMNILSTIAMDSGMNPFVHVAYRQLFASIAISPLAFFLERGKRPAMTMSAFIHIFLSSTTGLTLNQITYFVGLKNSTPTIACALSNLLPAITFLLAVPFKLESVRIKTMPSQAKVIGTALCVGGAMFLSFYHGSIIPIGESSIHLKLAKNHTTIVGENGSLVNIITGPVLLIASSITWAFWFIIQARVCQKYPAPYSSTAVMLWVGSFQCVVIGFGIEHNLSAWSLLPSIRAISSIYAGIVCSALSCILITWCIERKGPLYASIFSPLLLVIVAVLSWALLRERLYVGTVVGSALIVVGLYTVLWGKKKEMNTGTGSGVVVEGEKNNQATKDLELQ